MRVPFTKMEGLGNDFVVLDNLARTFEVDEAFARRLTDRRRGIGCDQLLVAERPANGHEGLRMRIFNTDGSEAGQCGNGLRCFALFARERGLSEVEELVVETAGGLVRVRMDGDGGVAVDMGAPRFAAADIPLDLTRVRSLGGPVHVAEVDGESLEFAAVSVGNPHAVLPVDSVDAAPVARLGPALQSSGIFPAGVNVGFCERISAARIALRVFERGVGETLACGTGACAAMACGHARGLLDDEVTVDLPGGSLTISWPGGDAPLWMCGPATRVFEGSMDL